MQRRPHRQHRLALQTLRHIIPRRRQRLGNHHHAAGFAVQAVDDGNLPASRKFVAEQITHPIPKRSWPARFRRMHQQTGGFVHRQELFGFTKNPELRLIRHVPATY